MRKENASWIKKSFRLSKFERFDGRRFHPFLSVDGDLYQERGIGMLISAYELSASIESCWEHFSLSRDLGLIG
jgi:hypothetical protein